MVTQNQNMVTEEEQKDNVRYKEINTKSETERTPDEKKEFGELKQRHGERMQKKIDKMTWETKTAKEDKEAAEKRADDAEIKAKELEGKVSTDAPVVGNENETEEISGKKYYTNTALNAQITSGKIAQTAAEQYAVKRDEERIVVRVKSDLQKEQEAKNINTARETDAQEILDKHPEFSTKHANYNPNDPLYVQWKELVADGYGTNPKGLTKALKKAKQILGIKDTHIDRSSELGLEDTASPGDRGGKKKEKEVSFTADEEQTAIDMYTRGDVFNPATGRPYTPTEAIAKAKAAKKVRRR